MLINPINNTINRTNFKAEIKPTESLKQGFLMVEKSTENGLMKQLNSAKDFLDSIAKIRESNKTSLFKVEIDKNRENYSYVKINGKRRIGGHNEWQNNIQDDYLVVEGIKKYASKLDAIEPSYLDYLKSEIEKTTIKLLNLQERYANRLRAELKQTQKIIFSDKN